MFTESFVIAKVACLAADVHIQSFYDFSLSALFSSDFFFIKQVQ